MSRPRSVDFPPAEREPQLASIAQSARGTFQTVEDMTRSFIREAILRGLYRPGERLNQDSIAEILGVSRMPVRASLRQLESEGLLQINRHRGAVVSVLRPEEITEIYELRILLETHLLKLAMRNLDEGVLAELRKLVEELEAETDLAERLDKRRAFYQRLYEQANRPRALAEVTSLRRSVGRYLLLQRMDEHLGHGGLMQHLESGDTAAAVSWLRRHLDHVRRQLQRLVTEHDTVPAQPQR